jgi:hypothetical protein
MQTVSLLLIIHLLAGHIVIADVVEEVEVVLVVVCSYYYH